MNKCETRDDGSLSASERETLRDELDQLKAPRTPRREDDLYQLLVTRGYAQHEASYIAYGARLATVGCNGSGFAIVDQNGGVGDCPGCNECEAAP
jgi:hypothetical protein